MTTVNEAPLHLQIRSTIQERISSGAWPADYRLPSEPQLATDFNVSRMTIRAAINKLVDGGQLYRRRGVGTFVAPTALQRSLTRLTSFSEDAELGGVQASSRVLSVTGEPAGPVAERLRLDARDKVVRVERLRLFNDVPIAVQKLWIPHSLCPEFVDKPALAERSIYRYLENTKNYRLKWGSQTISARIPTRAERNLLSISTAIAVLLVERTTYLDDGVPIEFSEAAYRGDEQRFNITLQR